jgi:hypothetical protein
MTVALGALQAGGSEAPSAGLKERRVSPGL